MKNYLSGRTSLNTAAALLVASSATWAQEPKAPVSPIALPQVSLPQGRSTYFVGEKVLLSALGTASPVTLQLIGEGKKPLTIYQGKPGAYLLDTSRLAPGEYKLGGQPFFLTAVERRSPASMQDESYFDVSGGNADGVAAQLRESGLTANFDMMGADAVADGRLDVSARAGMMYFNNPEGRPTSFLPVHVDPAERNGVSQRMLLTAQSGARYPNFGGFCVGFDTTGFNPGGRRMLLTYWGWRDQTENLRSYIGHEDELLTKEFKARTGMDWVKPEEYLNYTLSTGMPELAPIVDLPTARWIEQIAKDIKPQTGEQTVAFEKRLDAWSKFLMERYPETYGVFMKNLREYDPTMKHTASVQVDHAPTMHGQYFPAAYNALDFRYQSTWNDQVGGPDYLYQWLFTGGLLNMERPQNVPTWISGAQGTVHGRAYFPGKMTRMAAHNLANGVTGMGFALEGFSNLFNGMNEESRWAKIKGKAGGFDVQGAWDFLNRFVFLATEGQGDYGVGVLFSKTQLGRQSLTQGFGTPQFKAFVTLSRLGYTPVFLTEDEIATKKFRGVKSIYVPGQLVPLPQPVLDGMSAFAASGGKIVTDGSTRVALPSAAKMALKIPLREETGKPHNWGAPVSDAGFLWQGQYPALAEAFSAALGERGHAILRPESGIKSDVTLSQISGGADARYVVAVNDSFVSTQADWKIVREKLSLQAGATGFLYDLTTEKSLGAIKAIDCELADTTARVYALLPREAAILDVSATQQVATGSTLALSVGFKDARKVAFKAALPFFLSVRKPEGTVHFEGYRSTRADGTFALKLPLPANAPAGKWQIEVRSQLDGKRAVLPVAVTAGKTASLVTPLSQSVLVREKQVIEKAFAPGTTVLLPLFDERPELAQAAQLIQANLKKKGVSVSILKQPQMATYWNAFVPTAEQLAENARVEKGEVIGAIKNASGWYAEDAWQTGVSGYRSGRSIILLQVPDATGKAVNPMAAILGGRNLLWPRVKDVAAPVQAVVQGVAWAYGPNKAAIVIEANDAAGLKAAGERLTNLPDDFLTQNVHQTRARLFREFHIGGEPEFETDGKQANKGLSSKGLNLTSAPQPYHIEFGETKPYPAGQQPIPPKDDAPVLVLPAIATPKESTPLVRQGEGYIVANMPRDWSRDLRFSDALRLEVEAKTGGALPIAVEGIFRFSDRQPATQPVWEDYLVLRTKYLKLDRRPITFDVFVDGKPAGKLGAVVTGEKEVPLNIAMGSTGEKARTAVEEVGVEVSGQIEIPAGRHAILLIPRNIIDGQLQRIRLGVSKAEVDAREVEAKERQKRESAAK